MSQLRQRKPAALSADAAAAGIDEKKEAAKPMGRKPLCSPVKMLMALVAVASWGWLIFDYFTPTPHRWQSLRALPVGLTGAFAGQSMGVLLVAGGVSSAAVQNTIYVLQAPGAEWVPAATLPVATANGISISWRDLIVCIGGREGLDTGGSPTAKVFALVYRADSAQVDILQGPALPEPLADAAGVLTGDKVYVAGGLTSPQGVEGSSRLWVSRRVTCILHPAPCILHPVACTCAGPRGPQRRSGQCKVA